MMNYNFYAFLSRMKYINRWGLMRNTQSENIAEHSQQVAVLAHALAVIGNTYLNKNYNADRACSLAIFHDCSEIITGDMPTPIKYFSSDIQKAYGDIEDVAKNKLLEMLPKELLGTYNDILYKSKPDEELWVLVKAADTLSAYIKCIEELKAGNTEFKKAKATIEQKLQSSACAEVKIFMDLFIEGFCLSLDEQN